MRICGQYPEFVRGVPASFATAAMGSPWRVREKDLQRTRGVVCENPPTPERRPVLELPLEVRQRLGLSSANPKAQLTGARAKQSGREFEAEIELVNQWYERHGLAVVYRHHPAVEGWGRTLRVVGKGPADFSGVVKRADGGSIAVAFDCKVVSGSASYRHAPRDRHQLESLLRFREAGGYAFLLLCCRVVDRVWLADDLDTLWRGERVEIRRRTEDGFTHLLPVLARSTELDLARGTRPQWDYRCHVEEPRGG